MTPFPQVVWYSGGKGKVFGVLAGWVYASNNVVGIIKTFATDETPERFQHITIAQIVPSSHVKYAAWKKQHTK